MLELLWSWNRRLRALEALGEALSRRCEALEGERAALRVDREALLTQLASSESRLRHMLTRAERVAAPSDTHHLDRALVARKGF